MAFYTTFLLIFAILTTRSTAFGFIPEHIMKERHEKWIFEHGRSYKDEFEKVIRYKIFKENMEEIDAFNRGENKTYRMAPNKFADLTHEEFKAAYLGFKILVEDNIYSSSQLANETDDYYGDNIPKSDNFKYANQQSIPSYVDWREKGVVTPVKSQQGCGCCWAFSAIGAVESIHAITRGELISLSEQELVDCDTKQGNNGCNGGYMEPAFEYVIQKQGISSESNYPFQGYQDEECSDVAPSSVTISGYQDVPANNEYAMMQAVANQPISIALDSTALRFYSGGVLTGPCGTNLDHAVLIVGYGTTEDGIDYWIAKNQWGTNWGDNGYFYIHRGSSEPQGQCGIAIWPSFPYI